MFRRTFCSAAVMVPERFTQASDLLLCYPRFSIASHVSDALPELIEAKAALLSPTPNIDAAIPKLHRADEVFANVPSNPQVEKIRRAVTAAKCLALKHVDTSVQIGGVRQFCDVDMTILNDVSSALSLEDWDRHDLGVFDSTCVLLSAYVRSVSTLFHAQKLGGNAPDPKELPPSVMPVSAALKLAKELEACALQFAKATSDPEISQTCKQAADRLLGLQAVLLMTVDGELISPTGMMKQAANRASGRLLSDDGNPEIGLYLTLHAQMRERLSGFNWGSYAFEAETYESVEQVISNFHRQFKDPMTQNKTHGDIAIVMQGNTHFRDCYSVCLLGIAQLYQRCPREHANEVIFPRYLLSNSLVDIMPVGAPSHTFQKDRVNKREIAPDAHRKIPQLYLERALKINRALYPDDRKNATAAYILRGLATIYSEMRDYLYASGLFESADDAYVANFGENSYERLELLHLREDFQRRIGSTNEAAVTSTIKSDIRAAIAKKSEMAK